jgi:hypothetical protein
MNEVKMISFMPLDDDFFKWLRQSGHSNGSVERAEYTLDDEIRVSKLASHRLLTDYHLMEIPVLIAGHQPGDRNEMVIDVPSEMWALLERYLENFFPAERIYIPGRIISQEDLYFKQEYLFNMAYSHFERGINVNVDIFESLIFDEGVSLFELGIPVILKGDFDGQAVIPAAIYDAHASDLINAPDNLAFTREGFMEKGLSDDIPTLLESEFYKKLLNWLLESNLFGEQAQILVNQELLSVYDLPDYAKALRDLLKD